MARKMSNDIKFMVNTANTMLASKELIDNKEERAAVCGLVSNVLLNKNMYHGFNYYKKENDIMKLAGEETGLIQFYLSL